MARSRPSSCVYPTGAGMEGTSRPRRPRTALALGGGHAVADIRFDLDLETLRPLVAAVVRETIEQLETERAPLGQRVAFSETEAAELLGLEPHVLRDERRRGRIGASQVAGRRVRYTRQDLLDYLCDRRLAVPHGNGRS